MSLIITPETIEFFTQAEIGEVEQTITLYKRGRVASMATSWFAWFYDPNGQTEALPGTIVQVIGRQGLTLLVIPVGDEMIRSDKPISDRSKAHQPRSSRHPK